MKKERGTFSKCWIALLVCCYFSHEQITSQSHRTKFSTESPQAKALGCWIKPETGLSPAADTSRHFILSPVFSSPEHFPYKRSYSRRHCLGARQHQSCLKWSQKLILKAVGKQSSSPVSSVPCSLSALPWGCVSLCRGCHKPGLLNSLEVLLQRKHLAFLTRSMVPEGKYKGRATGSRGCISHCRRVTASGKEAPQLPLKRFLVKANGISDAKWNEGKCSDLVAELAWMGIE